MCVCVCGMCVCVCVCACVCVCVCVCCACVCAVADLGFHEGGFVRSGALARPRKILQTTPFYVV